MNTRPVKRPTADHPITVAPAGERIRVTWRGRTVADTLRAIELRESTYSPVLYIPREDATMDLLEPSDHKSYCPYKGEASYLSLRDGDTEVADAVWSYETPFADVAAIAGDLAFYPNKVDKIDRG